MNANFNSFFFNSCIASLQKRVDIIARVVFPLLFALFNLLYWVNYLWRDDLKYVTI